MGQMQAQHMAAATVLCTGHSQTVAKRQRMAGLHGPGRLQRGGVGLPRRPGLVAANGSASIALRHGRCGSGDLVIKLHQRLIASAAAAIAPQPVQPVQGCRIQRIASNILGSNQHRGINKNRGHSAHEASPAFASDEAKALEGLAPRAIDSEAFAAFASCFACADAFQPRSSVRQAR